jgi:O-methyltransferase involved in polyketide biosynthesis
MWVGRTVFGLSDLISGLQQRHLIIDHLLEKAVQENGVRQVVELACGFSPRGYRFMKKHEGIGIRYIEADLPHMAERKKKTLEKAGLISPDHLIVPCNILIDDDELCLKNLAKEYLDPTQPVVVITEGIINYFDPETIKDVWRRIGDIFNAGSGGIYLTDNCPIQKEHKYFIFLSMFFKIMGVLSRGKLFFHFNSDDDAKNTFNTLSFKKTNVYTPEYFYKTLPIPQIARLYQGD